MSMNTRSRKYREIEEDRDISSSDIPKKKKRKLTKAARERMSQAQKKRWAKDKEVHVKPNDKIILHLDHKPTVDVSLSSGTVTGGGATFYGVKETVASPQLTLQGIIEHLEAEIGYMHEHLILVQAELMQLKGK